MIFYNQSSFITVTESLHKTSSMILGEYDADSLLFSKFTFTVGKFILISFIFIMSIVFINLLLGITIGDGKNSKKKARDKANTYWIRELLYIESILISQNWFKSNIIEQEISDHYGRHLIQNKEENDTIINSSYVFELEKLLDILDMLSIQTKQVLEYENNLEIILKRLLFIRKKHYKTSL